jgi:hypothetical protein
MTRKKGLQARGTARSNNNIGGSSSLTTRGGNSGGKSQQQQTPQSAQSMNAKMQPYTAASGTIKCPDGGNPFEKGNHVPRRRQWSVHRQQGQCPKRKTLAN